MRSWTSAIRSRTRVLRATTSIQRLLAYATLQTAAVAALAVAAADVSLFAIWRAGLTILVERASGPAPVATRGVLGAFVLAVAGLYVLIPAAVAAYRVHYGDRHWLAPVTWAAVAVLGLPWLGYVLVWASAPVPGRRLRGVTALVAGPALVVLALRLAARRDDAGGPEEPTGDRPTSSRPHPPVAAFLNLALLVVLLVGAAVGSGVLATALDGHVYDQPLSATFDHDHETVGDDRGILTVTHDGGPTFDAERVTVEGTGFAHVPSADQTAPGPWNGSATGTTRSGERAVEPGDSVTIGVDASVASDCEVRVEYSNYTIDTYRCPDTDNSTDDFEVLERPAAGGDP